MPKMTRTTIWITTEELSDGKAKGKEHDMNFSQYVRYLLRRQPHLRKD